MSLAAQPRNLTRRGEGLLSTLSRYSGGLKSRLLQNRDFPVYPPGGSTVGGRADQRINPPARSKESADLFELASRSANGRPRRPTLAGLARSHRPESVFLRQLSDGSGSDYSA